MSYHFEEEIAVKKLSVGPSDNNVYVIVCPETLESVIVDGANEPERIIAAALGTKVRFIIQTHGHRDHTGALDRLREVLGVGVGIHRDDAGMLRTPPDFLIEDGEEIRFGKRSLQVIHSPGHTPGGLCFLRPPVLISGDTLFPGGPGATAGSLGNFPQIIESIRAKLFILPDETIVMPGHGLDTTIGKERPSLDEWIARGW